jgi:hypothetical protein
MQRSLLPTAPRRFRRCRSLRHNNISRRYSGRRVSLEASLILLLSQKITPSGSKCDVPAAPVSNLIPSAHGLARLMPADCERVVPPSPEGLTHQRPSLSHGGVCYQQRPALAHGLVSQPGLILRVEEGWQVWHPRARTVPEASLARAAPLISPIATRGLWLGSPPSSLTPR